MDRKLLGWSLALIVAGLALPGCKGGRCWWNKGSDCCTNGYYDESSPYPNELEAASKPKLDRLAAEDTDNGYQTAKRERTPYGSQYGRDGWNDRSKDGESPTRRSTLRAPLAPARYQGSAGRWNNRPVGEDRRLPPVIGKRPLRDEETNLEAEEGFAEEEGEEAYPEARSSELEFVDELPPAPTVPPLPPIIDE